MIDSAISPVLQRLVRLVEHLLMRGGTNRPPSLDAQLSDIGLTSIDMVNFMLAVEAEFDILIPQARVTPENFRSLSSVESLLESLGVNSNAPGS